MEKELEKHFLKTYKKSKVQYATFPHHIYIVKKWGEKIAKYYPEADLKVITYGALLHDIGHFIDGPGDDHAKRSEIEAKRILINLGADKELIDKVAHVVRSHRNKDIKPETIEAKIIAAADSASHITAFEPYSGIAAQYGKKTALDKLERDWRDISAIPKLKTELGGLYKAWKVLLDNFPEDFLEYIKY